MKRQITPALTLALLLVLPILATVNVGTSASPQLAQGWTTLMAEDFEGEFPRGLWHIGREGDPYLWGQRSCNPHGGIYSMWGGGGGTLGSQIPCSGMYTTGYATTLSYGPLDLSACSDIRVNFAHWTMLGAGDTLSVGYSNDGGVSWQVLPIYGDAVSICGGWCAESFNKDYWSIPLCGKPRVYLLFRFSSNAEGVSYGTFVDDVSLEAYYGDALPTATRTSTPAQTLTPTRTPTATRTATRTPTWPVKAKLYLPVIMSP